MKTVRQALMSRRASLKYLAPTLVRARLKSASVDILDDMTSGRISGLRASDCLSH